MIYFVYEFFRKLPINFRLTKPKETKKCLENLRIGYRNELLIVAIKYYTEADVKVFLVLYSFSLFFYFVPFFPGLYAEVQGIRISLYGMPGDEKLECFGFFVQLVSSENNNRLCR